MSAGRFLRSKYAATYGDGLAIHPVRIQPETAQASVAGTTNSPPSGAINNRISAQVSRSRRSLGLHTRTVTIQLTGDPPDSYAPGSIVRIPALTEAFFNACANPGTAVSYLGTTWETAGVTAEVVR